MNPEISIVVPMYNAEKYIETCIDSILIQTFQNFEVIVVDDCSTDRSLEIVQKKYSSDSRVKSFRNIKNLGEHPSRNIGLEISTGRHVFFMDADDVLLQNCLETLYNAIEESKSDVVHMSSWIESENFSYTSTANIIKMSCKDSTPRFLSDDLETRLQSEFFKTGLAFPPWLKLYRRDFLVESGLYFPTIVRFGDGLHMLAEFCTARKIRVIDGFYYVYRLHNEQTMRQSAEKQLRAGLESLPIAIEFLQELFASKKLIAPISKQFQDTIKRFVIMAFFKLFICRPYMDKLPAEDIDKILRAVLYQPKMINPELMCALIDLTAFDYAQQ